MSLDDVKRALDALDERTYVEGTRELDERVALMLPDGDVGAVDDPTFVDWLLEHAEPAPFGEAKETKIDHRVRFAQRLTARGRVQVVGFDPAGVIDAIEGVLSPRVHLEARLLDVVVYPKGGKFERHKDTPRAATFVGTLVVGLPVAHEGGAFALEDGRGRHTFDWSGAQQTGAVRWIAFYGDVDHEVQPVTAGARVTLVYALHSTGRPRTDPTWEARRAAIRAASKQLEADDWPVMIACTRNVVTDDKKQPQSIEALKGTDRDIADVLSEAGYDVTVRACLAGAPAEGEPGRFPPTGEMWTITRLAKSLTPKVIASLDELVVLTADATDDEGTDLSEFSIAEYVLDDVPIDRWVIRDNAAATFIHEAYFSDTGYFGNEAFEAHLYTLAALEVQPRR